MRLLVFDNCEHLLDAAADLMEAILAASTTVRIVATSHRRTRSLRRRDCRRCLHWISARVAPLPQSIYSSNAHNLAPTSRWPQLMRRARSWRFVVAWTASRWLSNWRPQRMASISEVRDRLDRRLLVGSRRGLERHHTLRHAVAWSYDHLDDAEKALLERCSVLAGGFDLESPLRGSRIR